RLPLAVLLHRQPALPIDQETIDRVADPRRKGEGPIDRRAVLISKSIDDIAFEIHSREITFEAEHDRAGLIIYSNLAPSHEAMERIAYARERIRCDRRCYVPVSLAPPAAEISADINAAPLKDGRHIDDWLG